MEKDEDCGGSVQRETGKERVELRKERKRVCVYVCGRNGEGGKRAVNMKKKTPLHKRRKLVPYGVESAIV